jgi:hypothetical protein
MEPTKMSVVFPFAGLYETYHSDRMYDEIADILFGKMWEEVKEKDEIDKVFNYAIEHRADLAYCRQYVDSVCKQYGLTSVGFDEMTSPKDYNFATDRIFVTMDKAEMAEIIASLDMEKLRTRVKKKHSSRSGFWSWVESDLVKWKLEELDHNQAETVLEEFFEENYIGLDHWRFELSVYHPESFEI